MNAVERIVIRRLLSEIVEKRDSGFRCALCAVENRHLPGCVVPQVAALLNEAKS